MKVAQQQSRDSGSYEFDRKFRQSDLVKIPNVPLTEIGDWRSLVYNGQPWMNHDFLELYEQVLSTISPDLDQLGYNEMEDVVHCLKQAGYKKGYYSFFGAKVPMEHPLHELARKFGFLGHAMSFSIQKPYSMTVCHMDHNFELVDGKKVRRGGFLKDYLNRKILIALEDARPGQAFCLGTQVWQHWKAGDAIILKNAMPHYGHNFSEHDRVFLMMSGVVTQEWCEKYGC
jgi:hypothetical protein